MAVRVHNYVASTSLKEFTRTLITCTTGVPVSSSESTCSYDLVVVGGGSGGLSCAKEAGRLGKKVAVLDYVDPSPKGTKWGLGGTCVNVGCIPKKLMHHAAILGKSIRDAKKYGWIVPNEADINFSWECLCQSVQNHIKSLNWGHRVQLNERNIEYLNSYGCFIDPHSIKAINSSGTETILKSKNFVIATGMRPKFPSHIPGAAEHAISSDDLFWLKTPPGKTLIVGASYVGLECAGFLNGLNYSTSLMIRSIPLRGFDQQMAEHILDNMAADGIKIHRNSIPKRISQNANGKVLVTWENSLQSTTTDSEFDTVLLAIGREVETSKLGLDSIGVEVDQKTKQVIGGHQGEKERTNISHIYALGDVLHGVPELTPVAVSAGKLLAQRLFNMSSKQMDYNQVPTTVFTPLEYGAVGLSEEQAIDKFGEEGIEVHHAYYKPLEYAVTDRDTAHHYIKVISLQRTPQTILGIHFLGPNAGEVIQGFAAAIRCDLTLDQLQSTVGIHPTCAEEVVKLHITKHSGMDPTVTGC